MALGSPDSNRDSQFTEIKCCFYEAAFLFFMASVYVLFSVKLNKYYVGSCEDVAKRLIRHNSGESKFTSRGIPWQLVYHESFPEMYAARKREIEIKRKKSRKYIEWLISQSISGAESDSGSPGFSR